MRASTTTGLYFALSVVGTLVLSSVALTAFQAPQDDPLGLSAPRNLVYLLFPMIAITAFTWFVTTLGARLAGDETKVSPLRSMLGGVAFAGLGLLVAVLGPDIRLFVVLFPLGSLVFGYLLSRSAQIRGAV